jgi:predicted transcriptional regulator YdeE
MPEMPDKDGEIQTIELVNEKTGEEESYVVHDVVEVEGETYYVLQAEVDAERVLILRREGESLVTLDDDEHDRVVEQLEEYDDEEPDDENGEVDR